MSDTVFCGSCGTEIPATAKFCRSCGTSQEAFSAPVTPPAPPAFEEPPTVESAPPDTVPFEPPERDEPTAVLPDEPSESEPTVALWASNPEAPEAMPPPRQAAPPPPIGAAPQPQAPPPQAAPAAQPFPGPQSGFQQPPPQPPAGGRAAGDVGDFANQVAAQVQTPGVSAGLIAGLIASAACLVVGLILTIALPDDSIIGGFGGASFDGADGRGIVSEWLAQSVSLLLTGFQSEEGTARVMPLIFVLVPLGASAFAARTQLTRTANLAAFQRIGWGAATGVPLAIVMVIAAAASGSPKPSISGAFFLALLWGALGGAAGVAWSLRGALALPGATPPALRRTIAAARASVLPFAVAFAAAAFVGTVVWVIQAVIEDDPFLGAGFSLPVQIIERVLYAADHGINYLALGFAVDFTNAALPPIPGVVAEGSSVRLFDFGGSMAAYTFVPLLLILIALPIVTLLYAGFASARAAGAPTQGQGAAWGLVVGPVWALLLVILNAMSPHVVGKPSGETLFGLVLLAGCVLGALGGLMATAAASD